MTQEKAVVVREQDPITLYREPSAVVEEATKQATALMDIVEKKKLYITVGNKKHIEFEGWQIVGAFNRTNAITESLAPEKNDSGEIIGWEATVGLYKDGVKIGGATMSCGLDAFPCRGKEGSEKHKAAKSAAQTWAGAKAFRMVYSWVAVMAGFQPLPAEEVTEDMKQEADKTQHWCKEHDTAFFKKGKMKAYAHPIGDTGEWCHEHKEQPQPTSEAPQSAREPVEQEPSGNLPEEDKVDSVWLEETLEIIKWKESTALSWIKMQFKVSVEGNLREVLNSLPENKLNIFVNHITTMREAS